MTFAATELPIEGTLPSLAGAIAALPAIWSRMQGTLTNLRTTGFERTPSSILAGYIYGHFAAWEQPELFAAELRAANAKHFAPIHSLPS